VYNFLLYFFIFKPTIILVENIHHRPGCLATVKKFKSRPYWRRSRSRQNVAVDGDILSTSTSMSVFTSHYYIPSGICR